MSQSQSRVPNQPRPFLPRVTDIGSLPYGGLPGRCVYGPDDPPAHFDATLTNHFVRPHPEASLSWDGHHLLQLLEQKDVEAMRVLDGYRPLVLEPDQYLARFWCRPDDTYYYFVCTRMQGLEYCSRFVRWVNVKSTLHPAVEATTGPGLQQRNRALDDRIVGVRDQLLLRKDQFAGSMVLEQRHGERGSRLLLEEPQPQRQLQVQQQQVQQQQPQEKQSKKQLSKKQQLQQMQGLHRFRLVRQEQPQQQQPQPQPQQMQQGQPMQEFRQFALAQQQWEQALERSSRQQQQKEEQGER